MSFVVRRTKMDQIEIFSQIFWVLATGRPLLPSTGCAKDHCTNTRGRAPRKGRNKGTRKTTKPANQLHHNKQQTTKQTNSLKEMIANKKDPFHQTCDGGMVVVVVVVVVVCCVRCVGLCGWAGYHRPLWGGFNRLLLLRLIRMPKTLSRARRRTNECKPSS